jgi:hypothetical protein
MIKCSAIFGQLASTVSAGWTMADVSIVLCALAKQLEETRQHFAIKRGTINQNLLLLPRIHWSYFIRSLGWNLKISNLIQITCTVVMSWELQKIFLLSHRTRNAVHSKQYNEAKLFWQKKRSTSVYKLDMIREKLGSKIRIRVPEISRKASEERRYSYSLEDETF